MKSDAGPAAGRPRFGYAWFGEAEAATEIFEYLLAAPYSEAITIKWLQLDLRLDPICDHRRFQALLAK